MDMDSEFVNEFIAKQSGALNDFIGKSILLDAQLTLAVKRVQEKDEEIAALNVQLKAASRENERLTAALKFVKDDLDEEKAKPLPYVHGSDLITE